MGCFKAVRTGHLLAKRHRDSLFGLYEIKIQADDCPTRELPILRQLSHKSRHERDAGNLLGDVDAPYACPASQIQDAWGLAVLYWCAEISIAASDEEELVKDIHPIQFGLDTELVMRTGVSAPPGGF